MKINERHLCSFAVGNSAATKEGYLSKKGEVNKSYQRRWFILKGNLLFYFEKKFDKDPVGVIILEGCTVEMIEDPEAFTFELVFSGTGCRTYVLKAESQDEMEGWMRALACASYDNMKHMVNVLQSELDEINARRSSVASQAQAENMAAKPSEASGDDLLIELASEAESLNKPRVNPFNNLVQTLERDKTFNPSGSMLFGSTASKNQRFDNMHHRFGDYIRKKMVE